MVQQINSVARALDAVFETRNSFGVSPWWRGHQRANWDLVASVFRRDDLEFGAEKSLMGRFRSAAVNRQPLLPDGADHSSWLFLARHHGPHVRLLDWTQAALTALYFAVEQPKLDENEDAALRALSPEGLNKTMLGVRGLFTAIGPPIDSIVRRAFSGEDPDGSQVAAVLPIEIDLRMLLQQSRFTIHDTPMALEKLVDHPNVLRKYVIPARYRVSIACQLETLGYGRSSLFPDLTTLASEINGLRHKR
ncbi:MAG TPA: FRG domain-containing protein [Candidatus Polarisedimenticolia bacterium]|jgi:hypothetical protein